MPELRDLVVGQDALPWGLGVRLLHGQDRGHGTFALGDGLPHGRLHERHEPILVGWRLRGSLDRGSHVVSRQLSGSHLCEPGAVLEGCLTTYGFLIGSQPTCVLLSLFTRSNAERRLRADLGQTTHERRVTVARPVGSRSSLHRRHSVVGRSGACSRVGLARFNPKASSASALGVNRQGMPEHDPRFPMRLDPLSACRRRARDPTTRRPPAGRGSSAPRPRRSDVGILGGAEPKRGPSAARARTRVGRPAVLPTGRRPRSHPGIAGPSTCRSVGGPSWPSTVTPGRFSSGA